MTKYNRPGSGGQAMILLLYVMVVGILVTTGAAYAVIANTQAASFEELGAYAYAAAESGAENAILRLIRNPEYTGETLAVNGGEASITVSTASGITVTSAGTAGTLTRLVEVHMHYNEGILVIDSWRELP